MIHLFLLSVCCFFGVIWNVYSIDQVAAVVRSAGFRSASSWRFIPRTGSVDFVLGKAQVEPSSIG